MNLPAIIVNFKLYENAIGDDAVKLAQVHEKVAKETGASIAVAVNALDLVRVAQAVDIPVFAQHFDPVGYGSATGHISPELLKKNGIFGSLLNHAECQISDTQINLAIEKARDLGLFTIVCANTAQRGEELSAFAPDLIAVEPPALIGGDISVSKADPDIVKDAVAMVGRGRVLVGAGVKSGEDVRIALELGASGVLLASGVTKAADPYAVLKDLVAGLL